MGCIVSKKQSVDPPREIVINIGQDAAGHSPACHPLDMAPLGEDESYRTAGCEDHDHDNTAGKSDGPDVTEAPDDDLTGGSPANLPAGPEAFDESTATSVEASVLPRIPTFAPLEVNPSRAGGHGTPGGASTHTSIRSSNSVANRPPGGSQARSNPHPLPGASGTSTLMPSIQSSEADRLRSVSWSVPSGPSCEPSISSTFMTLVPGDGPTSQQMWAQLGADVMMEIARRQQAVLEQSTLSQI